MTTCKINVSILSYEDVTDNLLQYSILIVSACLAIRAARSKHLFWMFFGTFGFWSAFQVLLCACLLPSLQSEESGLEGCNGISIIWAALMGFGYIISDSPREVLSSAPLAALSTLQDSQEMWILLFLVGNLISIRFILQDLSTLLAHLCAFAGGSLLSKLFIDKNSNAHRLPNQVPEPLEPLLAIDSEDRSTLGLLQRRKSSSDNQVSQN